MALTGLSILAMAPMVGAPLIWIADLQLATVAIAIAFAFAINGLAAVGFQLAAEPDIRGRVTALYVATTTVIGAGFGPVTVAVISGLRFGAHPIGLGDALARVGLGCSLIMVLGYGLVVRHMFRNAETVGGEEGHHADDRLVEKHRPATTDTRSR